MYTIGQLERWGRHSIVHSENICPLLNANKPYEQEPVEGDFFDSYDFHDLLFHADLGFLLTANPEKTRIPGFHKDFNRLMQVMNMRLTANQSGLIEISDECLAYCSDEIKDLILLINQSIPSDIFTDIRSDHWKPTGTKKWGLTFPPSQQVLFKGAPERLIDFFLIKFDPIFLTLVTLKLADYINNAEISNEESEERLMFIGVYLYIFRPILYRFQKPDLLVIIDDIAFKKLEPKIYQEYKELYQEKIGKRLSPAEFRSEKINLIKEIHNTLPHPEEKVELDLLESGLDHLEDDLDVLIGDKSRLFKYIRVTGRQKSVLSMCLKLEDGKYTQPLEKNDLRGDFNSFTIQFSEKFLEGYGIYAGYQGQGREKDEHISSLLFNTIIRPLTTLSRGNYTYELIRHDDTYTEPYGTDTQNGEYKVQSFRVLRKTRNGGEEEVFPMEIRLTNEKTYLSYAHTYGVYAYLGNLFKELGFDPKKMLPISEIAYHNLRKTPGVKNREKELKRWRKTWDSTVSLFTQRGANLIPVQRVKGGLLRQLIEFSDIVNANNHYYVPGWIIERTVYNNDSKNYSRERYRVCKQDTSEPLIQIFDEGIWKKYIGDLELEDADKIIALEDLSDKNINPFITSNMIIEWISQGSELSSELARKITAAYPSLASEMLSRYRQEIQDINMIQSPKEKLAKIAKVRKSIQNQTVRASVLQRMFEQNAQLSKIERQMIRKAISREVTVQTEDGNEHTIVQTMGPGLISIFKNADQEEIKNFVNNLYKPEKYRGSASNVFRNNLRAFASASNRDVLIAIAEMLNEKTGKNDTLRTIFKEVVGLPIDEFLNPQEA